MHKKFANYALFAILLLLVGPIHAHEIHKKDGKMIKTKTWEEDGMKDTGAS